MSSRPLPYLSGTKVPATPIVIIPHYRRSQFFYKQKLIRYAAVGCCLENPGMVLAVKGPQSRSSIPGISKHHERGYSSDFVKPNGKMDGGFMSAELIMSCILSLESRLL